MSVRYITHVKRDEDGRTIALCHPGEPWSPRGKDEAIDDIETGKDLYYTVAAKVNVVHGAHGDYLRTAPDRTKVDNLGSLSEA